MAIIEQEDLFTIEIEEPDSRTQEGQVLALLREAKGSGAVPLIHGCKGPVGSITPGLIVNSGIYQYNARIHYLRKRGYNITCTILKFINQTGAPAKVGCYRLENHNG